MDDDDDAAAAEAAAAAAAAAASVTRLAGQAERSCIRHDFSVDRWHPLVGVPYQPRKEKM